MKAHSHAVMQIMVSILMYALVDGGADVLETLLPFFTIIGAGNTILCFRYNPLKNAVIVILRIKVKTP